MSEKDISINVGKGVAKDENIQLYQEEYTSNKITNSESIDLFEDDDNKPKPIELIDFNDRFIYNKVGQKTYYNKPFFKGQSRQPGMYKLGYPKSKLFRLSTEDDVQKFNEFLALIGSQDEDPQITNVTTDKQFHNGEFVILATYNEMWYILPEQK